MSKIIATASAGVILVLAIVGSVMFATSHKAGPWIDTTDVVAIQGAKGVGRQVATPLINTDKGHMLVFFFTLAGVAGGTAIGYYWRKLMVEKDQEPAKTPDRMPVIGVLLAAIMLALAAHEAFSKTPFIDPNLGDIKLFAFISVGTVIGFIHGYLWKRFKAQKQGVQGLVA
jgi:ABC-type cobalt transport system substrate-binding protein